MSIGQRLDYHCLMRSCGLPPWRQKQRHRLVTPQTKTCLWGPRTAGRPVYFSVAQAQPHSDDIAGVEVYGDQSRGINKGRADLVGDFADANVEGEVRILLLCDADGEVQGG